MRGFSFRLLGEADLELLHAWVQRPHVAAWWPSPSTREEVRAEYLPVVQGLDSTRACIALLHGAPVGFIQAYAAVDSAAGWWEDERDAGIRGIDQFLADEARLGQGLGTAMIQAFLERLFEDPAVSGVQVDPDPRNLRAIGCYRKCGFVDAGEVDTPDGPAWLMRRGRA